MQIISIPYTQNITAIFNKIAEFPYSIWFNSGCPNNYQQKFDIISGFPYQTINSNINYSNLLNIKYDNKLNIINKTESVIYHTTKITPFSILKQSLNNLHNKLDNTINNTVPFWHGIAGYFGYDLNQIIFNKIKKQKYDSNIPIMAVGTYAWALVYNHEQQIAYIAYDEDFISHEQINFIIKLLNDSYETTMTDIELSELNTFFKNYKFIPQVSYKEYNRNFNTIKQHIKQGDCYQINYAVQFKLQLDLMNYSSWQIYEYLIKYNNAPFGCYFKINNNLSILSFSPERFLQVNNNIVITMPIKGTRPNVADLKLNQQLITDLLHNPKDHAENIMITDLLRNDLNKHCIPGSVLTPKVCELQTFPTVHHLVSTVTGILKLNTNSLDLLQGCFPGGSITGTPKLRAMQIIQEIENTHNELSRYVYCGSIGYINCNYNMDTNIAIRTVLHIDKELKYWAGSGIVADSECDKEFMEVQDKLIKTC